MKERFSALDNQLRYVDNGMKTKQMQRKFVPKSITQDKKLLQPAVSSLVPCTNERKKFS